MRERARSKMATLDAGGHVEHGSGRSPGNRSIQDRLGLAAMQPFPSIRRIRRLSVHDRSNSDSNLAHPDLQRRTGPQSTLVVSKNEIILGGEHGDSASVNVSWDIREDVGSQDWIGLYLIGERNPASYLSYKNRGVSGTHKGQIIWVVDAEPNFTKPLTKVCFKYYHGATGELRACTSTINIKNLDVWDPESDDDELDEYDPFIKLTLSGVKAEGLKKGIIFNPHPYIKFSIQTRRPAKDQQQQQRTNNHHHHNNSHHSSTQQHQQQRTTIAENTVMPAWQGQEFTFNVTRVDVLEIEVKDKFNRSHPVISRFLGKLSIPVQRLIEKVALGEHTVTYSLNKRHPSDHVSGYLTFTVNMEEVPDSIPNGHMGGPPEFIDMTRSASFPVSLSVSGDASVESSPRHSIISEELENAHNSVARSSSAPAHAVNHQREPKAIHVPPIEPPTPTDTSITAPISNEQWSRATQDMSERSLDQVESISCLYSLHGAGDSPTREPSTTVTTSGTNGESIHRPLTINIPGVQNAPALVSSIGTQVTPSPTTRPLVSLASPEIDQRTSPEENQEEIRESVDINITPPEESADVPASPLEAASSHSISAPITVSRRRSTDDSESVRSHPSLSPRSSLPNSLSRSPEGRHRALSDILLKQQIDEEVRRLRSRSSLSNSESSPHQSEQNSETGSSQSNVASPSTPFSSSAIKANGMAVERTSADSATAEPDAGSGSGPSITPKEPSVVDSTDGAAISHTRNNNNSLSQVASESEVPATVAGSVNGESSREEIQAISNGPVSTEGQASSVNGEANKSSPEGSAATTPAASTSREDVVPPMGTQSSAPPVGSRTRRRSSHRNSAVWQKRQGLRAAAAGLHVTIPGTTSESSSTDSPTTPVLTPGHRNTYQRYVLPEEEDPLPDNWEARIDQYGRVFYIDHQSRATTWTKPGRNQTGRHPRDTRASEQSRQQLDRRYQSIRRTLQSNDSDSRRNSSEGPSQSSSSESIPHIQNPRNQQSLMESPAVLFITRPDFFNFLHSNSDAKNTFQKNSSVKHMVNRIRRDPGKFADYQHNRDLVALLNSFADPRADLPRGWETKKDKSGKDFFIDHSNRATSFIDPRLPLNIVDTSGAMLVPPRGRIRSRSEGEDELQNSTYAIQAAHNARGSRGSTGPPPVVPRPVETLRGGSSRSEEVPMAYNEKVVAFLRQPNIMDILVERQPGLGANQKLKDKLVQIRKDGLEALESLSNDMELIMLLSLFEENIMSYMPNPQQANALRSTLAQAISPQNSPQHSPHSSPVVGRANARAPAPYKRDFDAKLRNFYRKLEAKGFGQGPTKLKLTIRRDHLLEDAFGKIMAINKKDIQKCKLFICFAGEEGLDYGGPSREFFFLLSRELFNPYYGLFEYSAIDTYTVQISPMSAFVDNYLEWFRFCGRVIGLAIIHHFLLDAFFTRPFYKALLRQLCSLTDLESLDSEFYRSLLWVKDNDITDQLDLTFTADEEVFGQLTERELKPNGSNIAVTEKNKKEYIEKMVRWRIERGVSEQTESLVRGFYEVVDSRLVSVFDARELELVIAGTAEIDVADWRRNTEYRGGFHDKHHVVNWFWMAVERFDNERRLRLLQFVTGTSSIPYEGFAALRGSNGPRKFCIEKWGKTSFLPRAHTCFNRLDLPAYPTYAVLMEKLVIAVEETSTFGID
ncbi:E3 ubiquitin-protein ligase HECW2-like isoform X2 [Lytechinus variegatus]|uniref:E3 ubiquitin-protein ligase HECW2-like isoform X2 n=1 Tax=Lytechinus variegatus TaxID=7654 RepID=UPI001BB1BEE6|nr:E3 ubiquitin-protein ligase HECW2-like isoform X2 [Lytechinus variegatus]